MKTLLLTIMIVVALSFASQAINNVKAVSVAHNTQLATQLAMIK